MPGIIWKCTEHGFTGRFSAEERTPQQLPFELLQSPVGQENMIYLLFKNGKLMVCWLVKPASLLQLPTDKPLFKSTCKLKPSQSDTKHGVQLFCQAMSHLTASFLFLKRRYIMVFALLDCAEAQWDAVARWHALELFTFLNDTKQSFNEVWIPPQKTANLSFKFA